MSKVKNQNSEVRYQKPEVRSQRSKVKGQKVDFIWGEVNDGLK